MSVSLANKAKLACFNDRYPGVHLKQRESEVNAATSVHLVKTVQRMPKLASGSKYLGSSQFFQIFYSHFQFSQNLNVRSQKQDQYLKQHAPRPARLIIFHISQVFHECFHETLHEIQNTHYTLFVFHSNFVFQSIKSFGWLSINLSYFAFCGYVASVSAIPITKYKTLTVHFSHFIQLLCFV